VIKSGWVPVGKSAVKFINIYKNKIRVHTTATPADEDILFLITGGRKVIEGNDLPDHKGPVKKAGSKKYFTPYFSSFFRHSLIEGGC
jgi:integrase/recombinase XerD